MTTIQSVAFFWQLFTAVIASILGVYRSLGGEYPLWMFRPLRQTPGSRLWYLAVDAWSAYCWITIFTFAWKATHP